MSEENKVPKKAVQQETPAEEAPQTDKTPKAEEVVAETSLLKDSEEAKAVEETVEETPSAETSKAKEKSEESTAEETVTDEPAFSWDDVETGEASVSDDRKALAEMYEETLGTSLEHQVVEGEVTSKTDREVIN